MRDAKGLTTRLVPMTIRRSALGKSAFALVKNLAGRFSPAGKTLKLQLLWGHFCRCNQHFFSRTSQVSHKKLDPHSGQFRMP